MRLLAILLFCISANVDNLTIGIAYGMKREKIDFGSNCLIAAVSGIGTYFSMFVGKWITRWISTGAAAVVGSVILILIGLWFIAEYFRKKPQWKEEKEITGHMSIGEAVTLAFALTINNLGLGIGASIAGLPIVATSIGTFLCSLWFIVLGQQIGKTYLSRIFGEYAVMVSGLLIFVLGVSELFF